MILFFRTPQQSVIAVECKHDMVAADSDKLCWLFGEATPESEENCAVMAADEIREYLENGNIVNSVNMPNVVVPRSTAVRVCIVHNNIPNMIAQISSAVSACNINIEKLNNQSRKDFAYTILDVEAIDDAAIEGIKAIDGVIRVRVIK